MAFYTAQNIHLVVTDVLLPDITGPELVKRLGLANAGGKVLYMSSYLEDLIAHQTVQDTGAPYLQKPFRAETLAQKVRSVLDGAGG
jgi:DNA-binding response OmpR family regulator